MSSPLSPASSVHDTTVEELKAELLEKIGFERGLVPHFRRDVYALLHLCVDLLRQQEHAVPLGLAYEDQLWLADELLVNLPHEVPHDPLQVPSSHGYREGQLDERLPYFEDLFNPRYPLDPDIAHHHQQIRRRGFRLLDWNEVEPFLSLLTSLAIRSDVRLVQHSRSVLHMESDLSVHEPFTLASEEDSPRPQFVVGNRNDPAHRPGSSSSRPHSSHSGHRPA
ncbi:hypothetical protein Rhopal_001653-T1 [Rhodotorula paludigena]|uniref:Uncharacterized protein n=1 Tax=Rhodotorula paludigena TaxID=86838 RepID=A0AAV5GHX7_9BASI|nr:hypothetical protein Rhopal_001653-T1 [Rhodotorula paludigena]